MTKIIITSLLAILSVNSFGAETYNYSGVYFGLNAQQGWSDNKLKQIGDDGTLTNYFACGHYGLYCGEKKEMSDFSIAPIIGIQKQFNNNFLFGLEASYNANRFNKTSLNEHQSDNETSPIDTTKITVKNIGSLSGKFGYVFVSQNQFINNTLGFVKLGYAQVKSNTHSFEPGDNTRLEHNAYSSSIHRGILYGLGFEKNLSFINPSLDNVILGLEYNYYDLNSKTSGDDSYWTTVAPEAGVNPSTNVDPNLQSLGLKIEYKFSASKF
jgi:opacity protein-like surface antigen